METWKWFPGNFGNHAREREIRVNIFMGGVSAYNIDIKLFILLC
jgi:hypothetical protein